MNTLLSFALLISSAFAHEFSLQNKCTYTVWPAVLGKEIPEKFVLAPGATHNFTVHDHWSGRLWGRTGCDAEVKKCVTGLGAIPSTLAEFTFDGAGGLDFYDVSLVDGYNIPLRIIPVAGTFKDGTGKYYCKEAGCNADLNLNCPDELAIKADGATVVCRSACATFKTDEYCCGGAHNKPQTCKSTDWPKNYPAIFKTACPDAYSYAYDDSSSTFTCHGNPTTSYIIVFCPHN